MSSSEQTEKVVGNTTHHAVEPADRHTHDVWIEDDPHRAALEDNPDRPAEVTLSTYLSVFFLGLSFVGPLSCGFLLPTAILVQVGTALGDTTTIFWIPGGWSIASSISFSIAGSLSDIFGRRYVILAGQALGLVGSIVGATAKTTTSVVAGSTIMGFGCGMVFVAYAGIPELLPNKWRNVGLAWTETAMALPWAVCSVIIGNALVTHATWRWCYYIGLMYGGVAIVGTAIVYFPPSRPQRDYGTSRWEEVKSLDYGGIILYSGGLTVFLIGLTWAGSDEHPWKSASVIAPIVVGVIAFGCTFVYDAYVPQRPFFPLELFKRVREYTVLLVVVFVSGMIYYSMAGLLPQGTLYMFTNKPIQIGLTQLPNGFANLVGGCFMPAISHKIKHLKLQVIVALTIQTLFVALYSIAIPHHKGAWMAFQFFGQGCFGFITLLCYFIAGLHVPLRELGLAAGLIGTFRSAGGSVGNAIFSTILNSIVNDRLAGQIAQAATGAGFPASNLEELIPAVINNAIGVPGAFEGVSGVTVEVQAATSAAFRETYAYAFKRVFWASIPFGVVAIVCACFIKDASKYLTNHTAVQLEKTAKEGLLGRTEKGDVKKHDSMADAVDEKH